MYTTTHVIFRDDSELDGTIQKWRPELGWFSVWDGFQEVTVWLKDVKSAVTPNAHVSITRCEDRDELQRAHDDIAAMAK